MLVRQKITHCNTQLKNYVNDWLSLRWIQLDSTWEFHLILDEDQMVKHKAWFHTKENSLEKNGFYV